MFVQSKKFVEIHQGRLNDISIYGQETDDVAALQMNLAIRGIDSSQGEMEQRGSFLNDVHPDLKADVIANPPSTTATGAATSSEKDGRWKWSPPTGNANYAWIQHFVYHLSPSGLAGFVLAKGALTTNPPARGRSRGSSMPSSSTVS